MEDNSFIFNFKNIMKKDYKHFILSGFIILLGLLFADILVGFIGKALVSRIPDEGERLIKVNYVTNRLDSIDVLIFGSSRAEHHYIPSYLKPRIDSTLNVNYSIYNAGIGGHFLGYNCCWIECILDRYTPKIIFLDIFEFFFYDNFTKDLYELDAYYGYNDAVTRYLDLSTPKKRIQLQSNLYKYNEKIPRYLSSIFLKKEGNHNLGYEPLSGTMTKAEARKIQHREETNELNYQAIKGFKHILNLCNQKGVKLIITTSPRLMYKRKNELTAKLCKEYNVPYIDMECNEFFNEHPEYFRDPGHLNGEGSEKFMDLFWKELEPVLK